MHELRLVEPRVFLWVEVILPEPGPAEAHEAYLSAGNSAG